MIPGSFDYHAPKTISEAIKLLDDLGEDAKILAGGHSLIPMMKWRLAEPTHLVDISRLSGLDYIKEEDLPLYYCNSEALVMPSLSGPTNIPPWEAFKLRVPVFYAKLEGIEDVLGNGAYYIDPLSPESLVEGLKKLFNNDEFKKNLVNNGVKVLESTKTEIEFEKYFKKLNQVINIEQRKNFD